jgi:uncharacterized FlaG/YvyC family protein
LDIRTAVRNLIPASLVSPAREERRTAESGERDPDGRRHGGSDQKKRALTVEELEQAIEALQEHPAVIDNGLTVRLESRDGLRVVLIEDRDGKVVRRIPEADLSRVVDPSPEARGVLLNRTG